MAFQHDIDITDVEAPSSTIVQSISFLISRLNLKSHMMRESLFDIEHVKIER